MRRSLGRMLLLWFLFPTLIPLSFIIVLSRYIELDMVQWGGIIIMVCAMIASVAMLAIATSKKIVKPLLRLSEAADRVASGDLDHPIDIEAQNEIGDLADRFIRMVATLKQNRERDEKKLWLENGYAALSEKLRGEQKLDAICNTILSFLSNYLEAQIGAVYLCDREGVLKTAAGYAMPMEGDDFPEFALGEGLVGQTAREKEMIHLEVVPEHYARITSAVGDAPPKQILIAPILANDTPIKEEADVLGVVELGTLTEFLPRHRTLLEQVLEMISIAISTAKSRNHVIELLRQREDQAQTLLYQKDMLREINAEMERRTRDLEIQKEEIEEKNTALERAQLEIERKARDLEMVSCYKTEFLANMSHELRTPLNSLLILSQVLSENREGNLTQRQVKGIHMIRDAGKDLLGLIDEILDLSNVQAGTMRLSLEEICIEQFAALQERSFHDTATEKGIRFQVKQSGDLPDTIRSDRRRLEQMVKNLLSNALKFTEEGGEVELRFDYVESQEDPSSDCDCDCGCGCMVSISVRDTGIGIAPEKQEEIFDTFTQVDGTRSRKYGGTGLGLSITRTFAELLGGRLTLESEEGEGSTFTIYLPVDCKEIKASVETIEQELYDPVDPATASFLAGKNGDDDSLGGEMPSDVERNVTGEALHQGSKTAGLSRRQAGVHDKRIACLEGKRVLIVDDDMRTVFKLSNALENQGMLVSIGRDKSEALEHLDATPDIDLVLADLGVLGEDGMNVARTIASGSDVAKRILIVLCDADMIEGAVKSVEGMDGFISRPVDEKELLSFLETRMTAAHRK